jgi:hypothetical protein
MMTVDTNNSPVNKIEFEGINFDQVAPGMIPHGEYRGVKAYTQVPSDITSTKIIVSFTKGIPAPIILNANEEPVLVFTDANGDEIIVHNPGLQLLNAPTLVVDTNATPAS